ncbi:transcription factor A, mitochondrial-like isoform X1 [Bombus bifarius]|uniref:Transcription factor A, mitochondrial-like isoform X1 n=1 Tax=Bombus bifarius TaxID=103933 RepID=A0A6P8MQW3_9HYME|nr:transcription factor A, mitochondrial-like isoform X1 [Bombus bifarius]
MVYFGRFIFLMRSDNLLRTRNCLLNLYQNASKSTLNRLKDTILPPKPKKPEPPFLLYVKHVKPKFLKETPDMRYSLILKRASKEWAELDFTKKECFIDQYHTNFEVYKNELKEYNDSLTDEQRQLWKKKKKEYEKNNSNVGNKRKHEMLGKPKKPPNAYFCYISSKKNNKNPDMTSKEWVKLLSTSWKELSEAEKESYITEATQLQTQYYKDLEKWEMEMIQSGHIDVVRSKILTKYKNTKKENKE